MLVNIHYKFISSVLNILTGRKALKVAKPGHNSEGYMGMMTDSCEAERGVGVVAEWHYG